MIIEYKLTDEEDDRYTATIIDLPLSFRFLVTTYFGVTEIRHFEVEYTSRDDKRAKLDDLLEGGKVEKGQWIW